MVIPLPIGVSDPLVRLRLIAEETERPLRDVASGWNPKVFFLVAPAFSFSECAIVMVASTSMTNPAARSGSAPDAHAQSRAAARAATTAGRCTSSMR